MAKSNKLIDKKFIKDYVKNSLDNLSKDEVFNIYKKYEIGPVKSSLTKYEMIRAVKKSKVNFWDIYQDCKTFAFGISAYELYELLSIDKKIKDKMIKENLLKVAYTKEVKTQFKKWINSPYFLLEDLYKIDKDYFEEFKLKIKPATSRQLAALEKARETAIKNRTCTKCGNIVGSKDKLKDGKCFYCIKIEEEEIHAEIIREDFKYFLKNKDKFIILDTETTGLDYTDEIVEISIIDMDGNVLLDTLIYTNVDISPEASNVNGIIKEMLSGKPTIKDLTPKLNEIFKDKTVLIYNEDFDTRMLYQSGFEGDIKSECLMNLYMQLCNSERWISLSNAMLFEDVEEIQNHRALGDCQCCLALIKKIAED